MSQPTTTTRKFTYDDNSGVYNEKGEFIAFFPENTTKEERMLMVHSAELYSALKGWIDQIQNCGVFKPRMAVRKFESIITKIEQ